MRALLSLKIRSSFTEDYLSYRLLIRLSSHVQCIGIHSFVCMRRQIELLSLSVGHSTNKPPNEVS